MEHAELQTVPAWSAPCTGGVQLCCSRAIRGRRTAAKLQQNKMISSAAKRRGKGEHRAESTWDQAAERRNNKHTIEWIIWRSVVFCSSALLLFPLCRSAFRAHKCATASGETVHSAVFCQFRERTDGRQAEQDAQIKDDQEQLRN